MDLLLQYSDIVIIIAASFAFLMAWGIGANDVSNAMGTSVGTKTITVKQAIIIAMIFEFAGAYFAGGEVVDTIRERVITSSDFDTPTIIIGMMSAILSAGIWLAVATKYALPVSTTHTIIGGIVGFAVLSSGVASVKWDMFAGIVGSWIITPVIAGIIAFVLFMHIQKYIFCRFHPLKHAKRIAPYYVFLTIIIISIVTLQSGLKHLNIQLTNSESWFISICLATICSIASAVFFKFKKFDKALEVKHHYVNVEKVFSALILLTACAMAFAHGSNDVANAIGPLASIVSILNNNGDVNAISPLPQWVLPLGAVGMVIGLATFGSKVMSTVGSGITALTPSRGFAVQLATASTVVLASSTGLPISTTQTLVGAIMGVGLARGIAAININTVRNIVVSWFITVPIGAIFSMVIYLVIKFILQTLGS